MELDHRGLEPPLPMVRTLEALAALPAGATLVVRNDRVPVYLLPQLDARGVRYQVDALEDGSVRLTLQTPAAP
jgi:TusA-related sulfurtransferase